MKDRFHSPHNSAFHIANRVLGHAGLAWDVSKAVRAKLIYDKAFSRVVWEEGAYRVSMMIMALGYTDLDKLSVSNDPNNHMQIQIKNKYNDEFDISRPGLVA